ncbi:MAG: peptidylprolyl isomerase [Bacteroidota bacterium]
MIRRTIFLIFTLITIFGFQTSNAQSEDPVLFSVADRPVHVSEFKYIYEKTNGQNANYSEASINEYLDLYTKFKLKVKEAQVMGLDSIPALMNELAGYRKQLASNYLLDKEVTEKLLREAYDRNGYDIAFSHILVKVAPDATDAQKAEAMNRIKIAKKRLADGEEFATVAAETSDDQGAKVSGGYLGYFTALQMPDFYSLESAAYNTKKGQVSDIVESRLGYHLVKVEDRRPARGEIKASHILVRVKNNFTDAQKKAAKAKIDSIYRELQNGADFNRLASTVSEDLSTRGRSGLIGTFGINTYESVLEDAAFGIAEDASFSAPVQSSAGWHILYRLEKPARLEYDLAKSQLMTKVRRDERYQIAVDAVVENIKAANNFRENQAILNQFTQDLTADFFTGKWQKPTKGINAELFRIGDRVVPLSEFSDYLFSNRSERMRKARGNKPDEAARQLYTTFVEKTLIKYEEDQLESKYPEFKALMREYQEGILLFEATKIMVWERAGEDTLGLATFYDANKENYKHNERVTVSKFILKKKDDKALSLARKFATKKSGEFTLKKVNKKENLLEIKEETMIKGDNNWTVGSISDTEATDTGYQFLKVQSIIPPTVKTLEEAKGYVVADYQDFLETAWVESLRKAYKVEVNQEVLKSLIR